MTLFVPPVHAQGSLATWNRLDVIARLDNDRRLEAFSVYGDDEDLEDPLP